MKIESLSGRCASRRLASMVPLLVPLLLSSGCRTRSLNAIAVVPQGTNLEFWKSVHAGAVRAGSEMRVQILWKAPSRPDDAGEQIQVFQAFVNMHVLGIALAPQDGPALMPALRDAARVKVPVVIFDSTLGGEEVVSHVATDEFLGGQLAGQHLGQLLAARGNDYRGNTADPASVAQVAMLRYQPGVESTTQREQGFLDAIQRFPGIKVVSSDGYGGATVDTAFKASESLLAAQAATHAPGAAVDGIFCPNESTALGMLRALEDRHLAGKVRFIGFDTSNQIVEALRQGHMDATVVPDPIRMGYLAVKTVVDHLRGAVIPRRIDSGTTLVRREEMDQPRMKELLLPDYRRWLKE